MKNWLPLVPGPALAMLNTPGPTCFTANKTQYYEDFQLTITCPIKNSNLIGSIVFYNKDIQAKLSSSNLEP